MIASSWKIVTVGVAACMHGSMVCLQLENEGNRRWVETGKQAVTFLLPYLETRSQRQKSTFFGGHGSRPGWQQGVGRLADASIRIPSSMSPRVQGDYVGFNIGNGEKLSYSQAEPGCSSVSLHFRC